MHLKVDVEIHIFSGASDLFSAASDIQDFDVIPLGTDWSAATEGQRLDFEVFLEFLSPLFLLLF